MENWQRNIILIFGLISLGGFIWSMVNVAKKENTLGKTGVLNIWGAFVVGDMTVFGVFWTLVSAVCILFNDWVLFLLVVSVFWVIRSLGETIYWFNQQFSTINRNPPKNFFTFRFFKSDAVWWIHQIFWQCISVISIICTIYFTIVWARTI